MPVITREQFEAYRKVQLEGKYNMFTESRKACKEANLPHDIYMDILWNYKTLYIKYVSL